MGVDPKEIAVTLMLISIFFHYFSFSFSITAFDYGQYDISLDISDLYASGIMIGENDAHNVTYGNNTFTEFELNETRIRVAWINWFAQGGDGLIFTQRVPFFGFDAWIDFTFLNIEGGENIRNSTMVALWETDHNWTKVLAKTGYVLFITDPLIQGNITRAVQEDGFITLTLAEDIAWADEPNLTTFVSWYIGLVTGAETWGLPDSFGILVRIMTMLGIFSGVFLLIEARRLIKVV